MMQPSEMSFVVPNPGDAEPPPACSAAGGRGTTEPVRALDRLLQRWRAGVAARWIRPGDRLLDVGCFDRTLIDQVQDRLSCAVGVDLEIEPREDGRVRLLRGPFPDDFEFEPGSFDCLTSLAVLEHVEDPAGFAEACCRVLRPGGRAVLTVPHPVVDRLLDGLIPLRLADGMSAEEHHGFDVGETVPIFERAGFQLRTACAFQLGLNRLFVFEKPAGPR
jgi:SAM-dependent methyltransferase